MMNKSVGAITRQSRLVAISEVPTQYHIQIFRHLFRELGARFEVVYSSPGQSTGMRHWSWGDRELTNDTGLLQGYPHRIIQATSLRQMRRVLKEELDLQRGDAVLFHTLLPRFTRTAALAAKSLGCRILFRGSCYQGPYRPRWRNQLGVIRDRATFSLVDTFCATGSVTWRYFARHAPRKSIVFSPYCVDEYVFSGPGDNYDEIRSDIRSSLGVTDGQLVVTYLGRFIDIKNLTRLLQAMAQVDGLGIRLVLGGDGPKRKELVAYIDKNRWIDPPIYAGFLGRRDVARFLCASDALALVSLYEPWGAVVNEALHLNNLCLVSSAVGASPDLVWEGQNGTYVDPMNATSIAEGMRRLRSMHEKGTFRTVNARLNSIFSVENAGRGILNGFDPSLTTALAQPPGMSPSVH